MSNNFITKISPSIRMIVVLILALSLILAKSIYLILFLTTLTLLLFVITDKKVNLYVNTLKNTAILLLILLVTYIIIFRQYDIISIALFTYKLIIIVIWIKIFLLNIDFKEMHEGLYGILLPLKKFNINIEKISIDIILSAHFIKFLVQSREKIKNKQTISGKKRINIKNFIIPCFIWSINELNRLQENLKIKFYKLNYNKTNLRSKVVLILFLLIFIICIFKEVML